MFSVCDWLLQGADHWDEIYAVLERDTLSLFQDQEAAAQVAFTQVYCQVLCRAERFLAASEQGDVGV